MKQFLQLVPTLFVILMITACGGGSSLAPSSTPSNPSTPATPGDGEPSPNIGLSVALSIANATGDTSNNLTELTPLTITATVFDQDNAPAIDKLITFTIDQANIATFGNDTGTALTNSDGVASIRLLVGSNTGDGIVTASLASGEASTIGFRSAGTPITQTVAASLELFASSVQIASSGSDEIELIALVKNQQNILLEGVNVAFEANEGASLQIINAMTASDGTARALLTTQNNRTNRVITAQANTSDLSKQLNVEVVGTEININGSSSVIINDSTPITIILADSDGKGIPGQTINLQANAGALDNSAPISGINGQVTVNYSSSTSGNIEIIADALNAQTTFALTVQQDDFGFEGIPTTDINVNTNNTISLKWFKNNSPFVGGIIDLTSSRGTITPNSVTTDANGIATFVINSKFAGVASVSALGSDNNGDEVTARATIEFVATEVNSIFVDATPDLIGPEGQTSTITAILRDDIGNLIKGKTVNFRIEDSSGGAISPNTAITDSNGIASTVYTSTAVSAEDAVMVFAAGGGIEEHALLTVGDRAFDISLGTGNNIESPDVSTYVKEFAVFVSDSVGRPINNANLTASSTPVKRSNGGTYEKGYWVWDATVKTHIRIVTAICHNEDVNNNGRLEAVLEDFNSDTELTPGIIGTIGFKDGITTTDQSGQATVELRYPKQYGGWTTVEIALFGQSAGTEAKSTQRFRLSVATSDINTETIAPPPNPFGRSNNCADSL